MNKASTIILLGMLSIAACKKHKETTSPPSVAPPDSTIAPKDTTKKSLVIGTIYYGQTEDYDDCITPRTILHDDSFKVSFAEADSTYTFSGSFEFNDTAHYKKNVDDIYRRMWRKKGYSYKINGDSITASYHQTHGQCVTYYIFRGKKKG